MYPEKDICFTAYFSKPFLGLTLPYPSSGIISKQNRLSMESEIRRTQDFNRKVSVETIFAVVYEL